MPATLLDRNETVSTSEPPFGGGPEGDARWFEWADSPTGQAELKRQAREVVDYYEKVLKPRHEPHDNGNFVVLERLSKEYEVAPTSIEARRRLQSRGVEGDFFTLEVGQPAVSTGYLQVIDTVAG